MIGVAIAAISTLADDPDADPANVLDGRLQPLAAGFTLRAERPSSRPSAPPVRQSPYATATALRTACVSSAAASFAR